MPDIKYFITTPDGNNHQVSEENIKKYGIDSYANSYKDATIRMRNNNGEDYHIPLSNYHDAVGQGLHPFRFDAKPDHTGQPQRAGSAARQVVAEFEASQRKNRQVMPERTQQIENSPSYSTGYEVQTGDYNNPANQWGEKKLAQIEDMGRKATPKIARPTSLNIADDKGRIHQLKNVSPVSNDYMPGVPMQDNSELPSRIDPNDKSFFSESDVQNANDKIRERQLNEFEGKANALGHKAAGDISRSMKRSNPLSDAIIFGNTGGAVPYSDPDVLDNDDAINAQAITNQVKDARELIREHKNTSKNPLLRAARGAGAAAKDSRTWDNGAQDMADTKAILDAAKRYEEGTASSEQQDLLDVAAIKSSLEGDYGDETGGMYGAGKNLIEMAPYMAKFIISPAHGAGQASAKYVAKVGIEKFGKTAMKSLLGKIARTSARVVGDMASTAAITAAFDQGQVMADANKRLTGDVYSEKDEEGNIHYSGRSGQESSTGTALGKSVTNDFEQNFGEMFGAYFSPVGKILGRGAEKIASKIGLGKVSNMITEASNSDWIKGFKNFEKSAQWNGVIGEYGEEVVTNMMNAATVGDNTWDTAPGTGVFNKDLNFDTFLGVALGAGFMSAFKSGQYATGKYSAKRNLNASNSLATGLIGETKWNGFKNQIDNADDKDISGVMQNILDDESLNDVQKKAVLQYTANLYRYHGANLQDIKSKMEGTTTPQDEAFDKGVTVTDPKERNSVKLDLDKEAENIGTLFKDEPELLSSLQSDPNSTIQKMIDEGYDQDKIQSATDYTNTKSVYDGMIQGVREEIDEKVDDNNAKIAASTNQSDGMLHPVTMKDGSQMYIVSGNVSLYEDGAIDHNNSDKSLIIRDPETGEQKMISTTQLESIGQTTNAEEYRLQQEEEIRSYFAKQASDEIEGILQFLPGDTYDILDQEGNTKQITIQQPVGDGVNVQLTDGSIVPMSDIQNANNRLNLSQTQSVQSNIKQGDELKLNIGGTEVNATVSTSEDSDGKYQVSLESPVNGKSVLFMNSEDINSSIIPDKVTPEETKEQVPEVNEPITENTPETSAVEAPENDGLVRDEKGMPLYEQSPIESTISDMKKQGADDNDILDYSSNMISDLDKESKALSKKKPEFSRDFATYKANKKALADQKEAVEKQKAYWKDISDAISKPAEPAESKSPSYNKTSETPIIPTDSKQRNTGKYVKENKQMGDYLNLHDRVLRGIASGTKFLWNDDGVKKGVSTELGFKGSEGERKKRIGLLASKDKGGVSIDELAHNIWEEREGQPWQNDDVTDIKNEIISVLLDNNGTRSMIDEAMKMHEEPDEGDDSYEAQNYIAGLANSRHIDPDDMQEFDSNIDNETKNNYEASSDGELYRIFAEKYLKDDENKINDKENGKGKDGKTKGVLEQIPTGENTDSSSAGGNSILPQERSSSEGKTRSGSERKSSKNDNVRSNEDGNNVLSDGSISRTVEDQSRPKLDQYEPISQTAKDKAKELDLDIEKQSNAVSKANKIVEKKREEISSRNGLFGDTKSTELFNETSDLSSDNLHKALDKYVKDYDFEKNKLDDLLANRDKTLKDIDDAESKQVNMFTSETPEEANVKRMSDIEERLSDIDSQLMSLEDEGITESPEITTLNEEKDNLESEYKGLKDINNESKRIQERKFTPPDREDENPLEYAQKVTDAHNRFKEEQKVDTNPSESQKEAGNYKKGHIKLDGYDISIENPKGSERSGKDADGTEWRTKMNNTYGYIRGTEGVDGDHIDVYLSDDPTKGDVYVVDQVDPKTGEFDEHKVMYGFSSALAAKRAYLSNYSKDWKGLGTITKVSKDDFKKWVDSSHRKTKPFADYKSVKPLTTIEDLIREANGDKDIESTKNAQDILNSRGIDWTNSTVNNKNTDSKRFKKIKDAKYDLMDAKRELSVATAKNSPYTESEIEEKRKLVKEAEDRFNNLTGRKSEIKESLVPEKSELESIISKSKEDGTYMKAPNGKETNLNEDQWVTVRTKSFKNWFGDWENDPKHSSKVVDENGEPMVVYHGTLSKNINQFDKKLIGSRHSYDEVGFFFTNNENIAKDYSASEFDPNNKGVVIPTFLNLKKPVVANNKWAVKEGLGNALKNMDSIEFWDNYQSFMIDTVDENKNDGIIIDDGLSKMIVAIEPNQIKSATENNGNFSKDNNDIRFSIRNKENLDKRYFEAIKNGNMEEAQRIIDNAASLSEYSNLKDYEYAHKAPNSGGINKEDFRNLEKFRDVVDNGEEYPNLYVIGNGISSVPGDFFTPNGHRFYSEETPSDLESFRNIEKAIHNMKDQLSKYGEVKDIPMVRVYRAVPNSVKEGSVRNGGWVTPSKKYAEIHKENNLPGKGKIIEQDVPADQLWWDGNSINEWGYDDGNNYAYRDTKNNKKLLDVITKDDKGNIISPSKRFNIRNNDIRFNIKEKSDSQDTQLRDALIEKMRKAGIDVITDQRGQDVLSKEHSYESDGIKYYRTANGEAYGYVKDGKIYIDTKIAGADTPIHEYTHLWSDVLRKENPEEWKNIVSLMKELPIWNEIKDRYTNLKNDDDLADEVLATYSGTRGAKKLIEEKNNLLASESSIFSKAKIVDIFNRFKMAIDRYWHHVADFLNIHYTSAEEVADQALKDLLNGVNPNNEMLHSNLSDENYIKTLDAEDEDISDELEDKYHDDGEKKLTIENIGPILYNMSGRYTKLINMRGVPGMVVHDNETDFNQAIQDYRSVRVLRMYQNRLREMLPRCTDAAKERVQKVIDGIDYTLRYYERQADGEEMWRTADQPMFSLHNYSKPVITLQTYYQRRYDRLVNSTANKWKESYQDSMLGLKLLQQEVESESGEKIEDFENAYMAENQLSSKNRYATEFFRDNYFDPMLDEVHSLMKQGASYKDVLDYIMSKHGLERNELFADENEEELGERDYSGLSSIFSESEDYIQDAEDYVANFEEKYNTDALWSKINAATKETLRRSFEGGLLGKEEYEKIRDMFSFYIPLRGWNENVASDFYEYITSPKQVINPAVKKMKGRTSLADDPLATIGNMGESTILQAGRNQMKQKFLNMAMNHESSLLTVKNMWYVNHGTNDNPDWQRDIPEIGPDASADDIHTIVEEHEAKMKELEQAGFATKQRGKIQLKYHTTYSEAGEHVVTVKRDGKEYAIYINGNPRAAQAINGLTNPDASNDSFFLKGVKKLNRQMSANFTSRNPAFVVSNLSRDIIFAGTAVAIKEPWRYTREYSKNIYVLAPQMQMWSLLKKAHDGTLSKYIGIERYFKEFLENGGETGYTNLHSTDEYKKMIDRAIMESKGKVDLGRIFGLPPGKLTTATTLGIVPAFRFIAKWTEFLNRSAEDTTRFATFMTSRQMGRSITRSILDAKEITVNFNKKGGNGHGAVFFRSIYLFFNPAVQGLQNMMRIAKDHPARFSTALFAFTAAGFIIPMLNRMLIDAFGGDDDKDSYNNLPEWQRRNNFVFYCGNNHFVMVPLPIELRAFYGLGEMTYQISNGNMKSEEAAKSVLAQMSDLMPVNLTGNNGDVVGNIMPDAFKPIYQSTVNVNYFGKPIYRKNEFNSLMPEYTKAYGGTSKALVKSAKFLNDISGGDNYTPGALNVNPATVEHYFEGYFGGVGVTINQVGKSISALWDEDMRKTRNIPVVNRLLTTSDYNSNSGTTNEKFYKYMEEYELTKQRERGYKKEDNMGSIEYAKKIDFLENSPEYARMEIIDQYKKWLKSYQDNLKKAQDDNEDENTINEYKDMINDTKAEMVNELEKIK